LFSILDKWGSFFLFPLPLAGLLDSFFTEDTKQRIQCSVNLWYTLSQICMTTQLGGGGGGGGKKKKPHFFAEKTSACVFVWVW
jgi:hypothetical protein